LRYKINGSSLRVEIDSPYPVNYNIQFLNLARHSENRISIGTDVFSSIKEGKSSADNGSNSAITGKTTTDFWTELNENLKTILTAEAESHGAGTKSPPYSIHRQGGLVTVYGTARQHRLVESYLKSLRQAISSQVLIEAKVIEVNLKDQYKSGINWQKLAGGDFQVNMPFGNLAQRGRFMDPTSAQMDVLSIGLQGKTFTGLLKAIEEFGASRTLSSPRLTVMNNQTAILKVAQNQVYFRLNYDKQLSLMVNRESVSVSSDIQTVPIGLVMSVQPSIDYDRGSIILSLRPTISRLSQSVKDPAVDIAFNAAGGANGSFQPTPSLIPVVEVREIDSVLRLQSGEIAVLGGLMEARTINGTAKLPVASDIPVLGELFKSAADGDEVIELVILLRATIIEEGESPHPDAADQRLYQDYVNDPRPLVGERGET
jgi:general secretion pathway protein D